MKVFYDFHCSDCEHEFEEFRQMGDSSSTECPKCGGSAKKMLSKRMSFVLQGQDFPSSNDRFNREMTKRNEAAGKRMLREHKPPKLVDQR